MTVMSAGVLSDPADLLQDGKKEVKVWKCAKLPKRSSRSPSFWHGILSSPSHGQLLWSWPDKQADNVSGSKEGSLHLIATGADIKGYRCGLDPELRVYHNFAKIMIFQAKTHAYPPGNTLV